MFEYAQPLHELIEELRRIPGIGAKTAQRIAFYFLGSRPKTPTGWPRPSGRPRGRSSTAVDATTSPMSTPA